MGWAEPTEATKAGLPADQLTWGQWEWCMGCMYEAVSNSRPDGVAASFHHLPKAWSLGGKGEATHGTFLGPGLSTWTTS